MSGRKKPSPVVEKSVLDLAAEHSKECALAAKKKKGLFGVQTTWQKPIQSIGLAVHPKRIKEAEAYAAKHGVPTDFTSDRGSPKITSRAQRKKLLKIFRLVDNDGGYGD